MTPAPIATLTNAREEAAAELEAAIVAVGAALCTYDRTTKTLSARLGAHLTWQLDTAIGLHLVNAGLSRFLEQKLQVTGQLGSLRAVVERQHERDTVGSREED